MPFLLTVAILLNLYLIYLAQENRTDQFLLFALWLTVFSLISLYTLHFLFKAKKFDWWKFLSNNILGLLIAFAAAFLPRILLLGIYPHVSIWDELRDAGLNAMLLDNPDGLKIFGFGSYDGYGNFIPLLGNLFLRIFGPSFLSYMVPAALLGTAAVLILYLILAYYKGQKFATVAAIFMAASLTQLHYSRTELVVISDSFVGLLIFGSALLTRKHTLGYLLLGLSAGLSWHFYAGSRVLLISILLVLAFLESRTLIKLLGKKDIKKALSRYSAIIVYTLIGLFIALGPTILYLNEKTLISNTAATQSIFSDTRFLALSLPQKFGELLSLYQKGLFVYFALPVAYFHYYHQAPLLALPLNFAFLIGITRMFLKKATFLDKFVLSVLLIHPLFSQVFPNGIGYTHRLMNLEPLLYITATTGVLAFFSWAFKRKKQQQIFLILFISIFYLGQLTIFFAERVVDRHYDLDKGKDYVFQFALQQIITDNTGGDYFLLNKDPYEFNWSHLEKIDFLGAETSSNIRLLDPAEFQEQLLQRNKGTFITFNKEPALPSELLPPLREKTYTCYRNVFGILYDCPANTSSYSYYYFNKE